MDRNNVNWHGNFCAVVTPFTRMGDLDEQRFGDNIDLLISEGIDGVVVAGHTGETWAISDEERPRLFALAVEVSAGRVPVIAGISAIRTHAAVAFAGQALEEGADGVLLTPPAYAIVNDREVIAHFQAVSDAVPIPIMMYNIPRRVGRPMSPALIGRVARVDNVVALKQSSPSFDEVAQVINLSGDRILVFTGNSAERGLPGVSVGVDGFISSVETQVLGAEAISLYRLSVEGKLEEARRIQARCAAVSGLLHHYGTAPAAQKAVMNYLGRPGGFPRPPILPLTDVEEAELLAKFRELIPD